MTEASTPRTEEARRPQPPGGVSGAAEETGRDRPRGSEGRPETRTPNRQEDRRAPVVSTRPDSEKSAEELEREIEQERDYISRSLSELRTSFRPGELVDQAFDFARQTGGKEFAVNLGRQVRDNPLPVLLMGAGLGWLMTASRNGHAGAGPDVDAMTEGAGRLGSRAAETAGSVSGAASAAAGGARRASARAGAFAHDAGDRLGQVGHRARDSWSYLAQEQPLVLGAIGIAVGAALAAAIPPTRAEDELMGETADTLKDEAREEVSRAKEAATEGTGAATGRPDGGEGGVSEPVARATQGQGPSAGPRAPRQPKQRD